MRYSGVSTNDNYTPFTEQIDRKDLNFKRSLRAEKQPKNKKSSKPEISKDVEIRDQVNRYFKKVSF